MDNIKSTNITWHKGKVNQEQIQELLGQKGQIYWFVGLSGSGKSTIAVEIEKILLENKKFVYRLDGDNVRHGLNSDLNFSTEDRKENIRRISEVAKLFYDANMITLVSFITPTIEMRAIAKEILGDRLKLVYVKASVEACAKRDPKGLYDKAYKGEIPNFTGVSAPFDEPFDAYLILDTEQYSLEMCVKQFFEALDKSNEM